MGTLNIDRYHATMGDAAHKEAARLHRGALSDAVATFYVAQRKLPYAPCLGHERLVRSLVDSQLDRPRLRFLEQDRGGLARFAKAVEDMFRAANYAPAEVRAFTDALRRRIDQLVTLPPRADGR